MQPACQAASGQGCIRNGAWPRAASAPPFLPAPPPRTWTAGGGVGGEVGGGILVWECVGMERTKPMFVGLGGGGGC